MKPLVQKNGDSKWSRKVNPVLFRLLTVVVSIGGVDLFLFALLYIYLIKKYNTALHFVTRSEVLRKPQFNVLSRHLEQLVPSGFTWIFILSFLLMGVSKTCSCMRDYVCLFFFFFFTYSLPAAFFNVCYDFSSDIKHKLMPIQMFVL